MASQAFTVPYLPQIKDYPVHEAIRIITDQVATLTRGSFTGTLNPDQKPTGLAGKDAGIEFFSTDFARLYRWTGLAWEDSPDAERRFQVTPFAQAPEPPIGWAPCDGRHVTISTKTALVASYQTPVVPNVGNLQYWVRL
jgi:tail collar domain